jgi:hypothetical protein
MIPFSGTGINQPILNVTTRDIVGAHLYHFLEQSADAISQDKGCCESDTLDILLGRQ